MDDDDDKVEEERVGKQMLVLALRTQKLDMNTD